MRPRRPLQEHLWLEEVAGPAVLLHLVVADGVHHNRVMGVEGRRLKLQVAGGQGGGGDRALLRYLAAALAVPTAQLRVVAAARGGRRTVRCAQVARGRCLLALAPRG